jgi:short-subunit dehydrogenase
VTVIQGKLALVTGASRGIGAATALALARRGARLVLVARSQPGLEAVAAQISALGGQAHVFPCDLADESNLERLAQRVLAECGPPDLIVNNAGTGQWLFAEETGAGQAAAMMALPYLAAFNLTRLCLPAMLARRSGHIVNITSAAAYRALPGATAYNAACWAMRGFSEALRVDLAGTSLRVTLLASGTATTPGFDHYPGVVERTPGIVRLAPLLTPERVAQALVRGLERNERVVVIPLLLKLMLAVDGVLPRLTEWLVVRTGWRHPHS